MDRQTTLSIVSGRVLDPVAGIDRVADLHVDGSRILAIGDAPSGFDAARTIDASGCWVMPGLVDLAARLREPGYEYKATLESELGAALAGGIVSVCCPPDTDPPLDEPGLVEMLKHRARQIDGTRVYPIGALVVGLDGVVITEMAQLATAGCVGFGLAGPLMPDTQSLLHAMDYAHTFGYTVWLRPQDPHLGRGGVAHAGAVAGRLGLAGVPDIAETVALNTIFDLVRATGCRVHLCRLSSAKGVALVREAKREGLPISCDVAVHHLHLCDIDIGHFDTRCRVDPPFRAQRDRDAIRAGLADGTIDVICSDHTPVDDDAKQLPFGEAEPGVTGLELLLPLASKWASEDGIEPLALVALLTANASSVIRYSPTGIGAGAAADLCVFDPSVPWRIERSTVRSQSCHTPYLGRELLGRVRATVVGGRVAFGG
ncbi:MAG: dihydroorotase [Burkholderiaceae bacterium]|nr:dihydroorotase [Burkholderiaceae bacterium]